MAKKSKTRNKLSEAANKGNLDISDNISDFTTHRAGCANDKSSQFRRNCCK